MVYENINNIGSFGEPGYCVNHRCTRRGGGGVCQTGQSRAKNIADGGGGGTGALQWRETF